MSEHKWKTVPATLTDEMAATAARIADGPVVSFQEHWDAMLSASPVPPVSLEEALKVLGAVVAPLEAYAAHLASIDAPETQRKGVGVRIAAARALISRARRT